jgi:glycosyltransferase involved in cell wall biosynthesis
MTKILYVVTRAERGGGQAHVLDLLRGFQARYECHLATGEEGFLCDEARAIGVPIHLLPHLVQPIAVVKDLRAIVEICALFKRLKPDLVHAHTSKAGLLARLAGFITGVPVVFTAHTWSFAEGVSRKRKAIALPLERIAGIGSRIITVSENNRRLALAQGVAREPCLTTVWNGIPDTPLRAVPESGGRVRIVMVARFAEQKDQILLLQALSGIDEDFEVAFVGDGPTMLQARQAANQLGLTERVHFLGDRSDVAELLAQAHVFSLSTKWEGLPLSILEAMRAGLPVISSDVGGVRESVEDGVTGLLVPAGDVDAMRVGLLNLIRRPELRRDFGEAGRVRYERDFTLNKMLTKTARVYDEVIPAQRQEAVGASAERI